MNFFKITNEPKTFVETSFSFSQNAKLKKNVHEVFREFIKLHIKKYWLAFIVKCSLCLTSLLLLKIKLKIT